MTDLRKLSSKPISNVLDKKPYLFSYTHESITNDISEIRYIKIPKSLRKHNFLLGLVEFSKTSYFRKLAAPTQNSYRFLFENLCEFCEKKPSFSSVEDIGFITPNFKNYLIEKKTAERTIFLNIAKSITFITFMCDPLNGMQKKEWWHPNFYHVKNHIKKTPRPLNQQFKSLADIQGQFEYTDEQLLVSLRRVSLWLLKELNEIKKTFLNIHKGDILQLLKNSDDKIFDKSNLYVFARPGSKIETCSLMIGFINTAIEKLPSLAEFYFYDRGVLLKNALKGEAFSIDQINDELSCQIKGLSRYLESKNIDFPKGRRSFNQKDDGLMHIVSYFSSTFQSYKNMPVSTTFPPGAMISNTIAEEIAFTWFLASERIQGTPIDNLKTDNVITIKKSKSNNPVAYQITWQKARNNSEFSTPIYKKGEPAFKAIDFYLENVEALKNSKLKMRRNGYLNQKKINILYNSVHGIPNSTSLPITLLGLRGSVLQNKCLNEVDQSEPFIRLLENIVAGNYEKYTQRIKYDNSRHRYNYGLRKKAPERKNYVNTNFPGISLANIAQSRALLDDSLEDDLNVTSKLSAHNTSTHFNTYLSRSDISKNPESRSYNFAEKVGDEMLEMAKRIAGYKSNVEVIDIDTLKSKLGLSHPGNTNEKLTANDVDQLFIEARKNGYGVGTLGELSSDDTTYIIQTPLVAAMILEYLAHIDQSLNQLSRDSEQKVNFALIHKAYLESILDFFPKKLIHKAKKLLVDHSFPFPSLL